MANNGQTSRPDDRLVLHPDAAANFNEKALVLSGHFGPVQIPGPSGQRSFSPDRHVDHTFSVQDVTNLQIVVHDPEGREVCLAFRRPNGPVGLKGDGCALFRSLARQVWQAGRLRQAISLRFAEGGILSWLGARHEEAKSTTMIDDLLQRAVAAVEPRELWVPIAALYVQSELQIGPITIRTIDREMLASWRERVLGTVHGEEERAKTNALRLYARSSLEAETADRVIYILAALESLLLKNGGESIQQNVA